MRQSYDGPERRQSATINAEGVREAMHTALQQALTEHNPLSEEERRWVRLAIQREAQSIALRRAIIEKTLAGLAWAAVIAIGVVVYEYLRSHGLDLAPTKVKP